MITTTDLKIEQIPPRTTSISQICSGCCAKYYWSIPR